MSMMMRKSLPITLMVVAALVLIIMTLQADTDDAILKHDKEPEWQLLNQTPFGRKALAGVKDPAEEVGESKKSSMSGYMTDLDNGGSDDSNNNTTDNNSGNNSSLHLNNHHYFTDPRKLPPRN